MKYNNTPDGNPEERIPAGKERQRRNLECIDLGEMMICPNCGKQNKEGASFCTECGMALTKRTEVNITRRSRRSKYLAAGILVFAIAALLTVFFIFFSGTPVEGQWYSKETLTVLDFKDGQAQIMTLTGMQLSEYEYSRQRGEGNISFNGKACPLNVEKDELTLQSPKGSAVFTRAKEDIDTEEFIKQGLLGLWSNEELALVLELKENGEMMVHSIDGKQGTVYDYDAENGEGSLIIDGKKAGFTADNKELNITGTGIFTKQEYGFDMAAFIEKFGNPLKGVWYDAAGVMGEFDFQDSGILLVTSYGTDYRGTYAFSNAEHKGTLSFGNKTMDVACSAGVLSVKGRVFTKDYKAQKVKSDIFEQLAGTWYDKQGNGTIQISKSSSAVFERDGNPVNAVCVFDPLDGSGTITLYGESGDKVINLFLSNGILAAGSWLYTRDVVEQANSGITGIWYDSDGRFGTLALKSDGSAELKYAGNTYSGTYTFDKALGKGTVSTVFNGQVWEFELELQGEYLIVRTGIIFYEEITFIREPVKQP